MRKSKFTPGKFIFLLERLQDHLKIHTHCCSLIFHLPVLGMFNSLCTINLKDFKFFSQSWMDVIDNFPLIYIYVF